MKISSGWTGLRFGRQGIELISVLYCQFHVSMSPTNLSFRRKPESFSNIHEIPAFAGMTDLGVIHDVNERWA